MNSCTNCGQSLRLGARFCGGCGTAQTPQAEAPTERLPRKPSSGKKKQPAKQNFLLVAAVGVLVVLLLLGGGLWWMSSRSSQVVSEALGTATVLISTAVPGADLEGAVQEARESLERNPKLATLLNELLIVYEQDGFEAALAFAQEKELVDEEGYLSVVLVLDVDDSTEEGQEVIQTLQSELESKEVIVEGTFLEEMTVRIPVEKAISQAEGEGADSLLDDFTQLEHVQYLRLPTMMFEDGDGVVGEGVSVSNADEWHEAGFRGQGVKVGVIDLGFEGYEELLGNGLPANVHLAPNFKLGNHAHGTGVAEIVHEMAPEAELYFALAGSPLRLRDAVSWMADNGVKVINYSVGDLAGPFDGTSKPARIVDQATDRGILWVNSAGNYAESHWSDTFRDEDNNGLHEFAPGLELLPIEGGLFLILSWWEGNREANYDLCIFDELGSTIIGCSVDAQSAESGIEPVEGVPLQRGKIYQVAIVLDESAPSDEASQLKLFVSRGDIAPNFQVAEGSVGSSAAAQGALAVGAVEWQKDELTYYSSQGPTADGRNKPELSAPTHVQSASYPGSQGFGGTSAAAPHVTGAAALVLSAFPEMSRDEVADYLISHATDLGPSGYDLGYGEGRLALGSPPEGEVPPPAASTPTTTAPTPAASSAFTDDFSDSKSGLPHQASDEGWSSTYEDGMYVMTAEFFPFGSSSWERYQGLEFDDFTLNVEAERLEGVPSDYYGVVFRVQDNDNYHLFQLSDLGLARWQQVVDGEMDSLVEAKIITVNSNKANKITIEAQGKQLTVSVNGKEVHTIDDDPIGHGRIGFMVTNQGLPFTAGFDNLSVTR